MRSTSTSLGRLAAIGLLSVSGAAHAEPAVWYRAGENCPDGASFLERLSRRGVRAHLAQVGDQIDFVVTVGPDAAGSSGRLERQTAGGTIAIRQVTDARCEAVADVLALTLALTSDPAAAQVAPAPAAEPAAPVAPAVAPPPAVTAAPAEPVARAPRVEAPPPVAVEARATFSLGAAASASDVFEGPWLFAVGIFGELEAPRSFVLPRASVRAVVQGGGRVAGSADAKLWLAAGRIEGCPVGLELGRLDVRPCAAFEAGAIGASAAGGSDSAGWLAAAAHGRASLGFGSFALEAQAGVVLPITRYEVAAPAPAPALEQTKIIGFSCGLGARFRLE